MVLTAALLSTKPHTASNKGPAPCEDAGPIQVNQPESYQMINDFNHLADATLVVVAHLRAVSARLMEAEPHDKLKRWALACEMCRTAGADFRLDPEEFASPLVQVIDALSNAAVRVVYFDHDSETLTLTSWNVAECSVTVPLDWFDEALVMVDRDWGSATYPYEAPSVVAAQEAVTA